MTMMTITQTSRAEARLIDRYVTIGAYGIVMPTLTSGLVGPPCLAEWIETIILASRGRLIVLAVTAGPVWPIVVVSWPVWPMSGVGNRGVLVVDHPVMVIPSVILRLGGLGWLGWAARVRVSRLAGPAKRGWRA